MTPGYIPPLSDVTVIVETCYGWNYCLVPSPGPFSVWKTRICVLACIVETWKCWRSNKLALAINYDTQLVSVLLEWISCGSFRHFLFSLIFAGTLFIRNLIPCISFQYNFRSYHSPFPHLIRTYSFSLAQLLLYRSENIGISKFALYTSQSTLLTFRLVLFLHITREISLRSPAVWRNLWKKQRQWPSLSKML